MKKTLLIFALFFLMFLGILQISYKHRYKGEEAVFPPEKIISLSPSVTETLYMFGVFDKVLAVTRYCVYPPEVSEKPAIGGVFDINYEAIMKLKPDLVIINTMQQSVKERLDSMGIKNIMVYHNSLDGVLESFDTIGDALGLPEKADELKRNMHDSINAVIASAANAPKKTVMQIVSRTAGDGVTTMIVAGNEGYYSEIIKMLNGWNPFESGSPFPSITREGLFRVNPDVIIELNYSATQAVTSIAEWSEFAKTSKGKIKALSTGHICNITESYGYVPGPRMALLIKDMASCIHPEIFGEKE